MTKRLSTVLALCMLLWGCSAPPTADLTGGANASATGEGSDRFTLSGSGTAKYDKYTEGVIGNGETSLLFFHAQWCPYCRAHGSLIHDLYQQGVPKISTYEVDFDTGTELKEKFGVVYQHTFVLIDGKGKVLAKKTGSSDTTLRNLLLSPENP